ncbi:MAG TPA: hypothetical protein VNA19_05020 [Pyrinomonadaceae bacterium]|jgi:hypothetical protein|nr:hypothetical protein [Pyrinomonadaceae bacterium]
MNKRFSSQHFSSLRGYAATFFATAFLLLTASQHAAAGAAGAAARAFADEAEARAALERAFQTLRAGDYGALYQALPTASQRRISRERFISGLNRARGMYALDRLEIGNVHVSGDLAVVDTVIYGRALKPVEGEGKIVARQYLRREGGSWRVTTGDRSTIRPLLAANPSFARQFPPREPRVYLKRDGKWIDISTLTRMRQGRKSKV